MLFSFQRPRQRRRRQCPVKGRRECLVPSDSSIFSCSGFEYISTRFPTAVGGLRGLSTGPPAQTRSKGAVRGKMAPAQCGLHPLRRVDPRAKKSSSFGHPLRGPADRAADRGPSRDRGPGARPEQCKPAAPRAQGCLGASTAALTATLRRHHRCGCKPGPVPRSPLLRSARTPKRVNPPRPPRDRAAAG